MNTKTKVTKKEEKKKKLMEIEEIHGTLPDLDVADIVLIRIKGNFKRSLLRRVTNSYWDHVAMVIFEKNPTKGFPEHLLIESAPGGVMIHKLRKYMNNSKKYDVGIKRVTWLSEDLKNRVRALMLLNVDAPYYPYSFWKLVFSMISDPLSRAILGRQRYSCSSFVQKCFYEAMDWNDRHMVVFSDDYVSPLQFQNVVPPASISKSPKSEWIYNKHK
jgi:hypothetical protein